MDRLSILSAALHRIRFETCRFVPNQIAPLGAIWNSLWQILVLDVIFIESVQGELSLFPVGVTRTILFESVALNLAEHEALAERYCPCVF